MLRFALIVVTPTPAAAWASTVRLLVVMMLWPSYVVTPSLPGPGTGSANGRASWIDLNLFR